MTATIVVISRDDTFMHVGPPDQVARHLFGAQGDIALLPPGGGAASDTGHPDHAGGELSFGDLDTFDEAGLPLEWAVDRYLRPQHVHAVPGAQPDPDVLLERIRSVVANLNAQIEGRSDLAEFRSSFYAERLALPTDLTTAVNTFADLGRQPPSTPPTDSDADADTPTDVDADVVTHAGEHVDTDVDAGTAGDWPGSTRSRLARGPATTGHVHPLPGHVFTPGDDLPPAPGHGVGSIPHSGSWFHNLMHRITGT